MVVVYKTTEMAPILGEAGHEADTPLVGAWTLVGLRRVYAPSIVNVMATRSLQAARNHWLGCWGTQPVGLWLSERAIAGWGAGTLNP